MALIGPTSRRDKHGNYTRFEDWLHDVQAASAQFELLVRSEDLWHHTSSVDLSSAETRCGQRVTHAGFGEVAAMDKDMIGDMQSDLLCPKCMSPE